jgi:sensor domain CHASE-containing protein
MVGGCFELPHGFLKYFKGFLMKKIVTFVILAVLLGFLGGCDSKKKGEAQFNEYLELHEKDAKKAEKLLEKSCDNESAKGCATLALDAVRAEESMSKVVEYIKKAIDIKLEETQDDEEKYGAWKEVSSELHKVCENERFRRCQNILTKYFFYF